MAATAQGYADKAVRAYKCPFRNINILRACNEKAQLLPAGVLSASTRHHSQYEDIQATAYSLDGSRLPVTAVAAIAAIAAVAAIVTAAATGIFITHTPKSQVPTFASHTLIHLSI